jgi:hypothetical protein
MKVSQLKNAAEQFLISHGDGEVKLVWELGCFEEGYNPDYEEPINDVRVVPDWPLPGCSLVFPNEEIEQKFVLFYGDDAKEKRTVYE